MIPALGHSQTSHLLAIASREPKKAERASKRWAIPRWYGGYDALLAAPDIDVVYIPLPNQLHHEWIMRSLQAGKHVLCEKPLVLNAQEVDQIAETARKSNLQVLEGYPFRHHPVMEVLEDVLRRADLGPVFLVKGHFSFYLSDAENIRLRPELGGGSLWDIGCYPVCFAQAIFSSLPTKVLGYQQLGPTGVDMVFLGTLVYPGDRFAQIECSFRAPYRVEAEIVCEKGSLRLQEAWRCGISGNSGIDVIDQGGRLDTVQIPDADPFACEVAALEELILEQKKPRYDLGASRTVVDTLESLKQAAESGQPVYPD